MPQPRIAVVDGQGGGVGKALIERLRQVHGRTHRVLALGANAHATAAMLKAGADAGATGPNAIAVNVARADLVMGALGVVAADAMLGEITPDIARAIGQCAAPKILVPIHRCRLRVAGLKAMSFADYVAEAVDAVAAALAETDDG